MKILIPLHTLPDVKSVTTIFFENLMPILKTKLNVHILWLVYTPERIISENRYYLGSPILDIHDYKNALDVIQKEKPDIIYASESWHFIDYALSSVAKIFHIPVFCMIYSNIYVPKSLIKNILSNMSRFFQNSIPTDRKQDEKKFMKRGRFYIYKYIFLLRTMMALKKNRLQTLFTIWKFVLLNRLDPRFGNDVMQFLENDTLLKQRLDLGFNKSNLVVTGNPIYDVFFHKMSNQENMDVKDGVIRILFAPSTLYEHGFWTKKQRDYAVKETIRQISKMGKSASITVKIHPSSSVMSDYESLIHSIDSTISVHQEGDIQDYVKNSDVVLTFQSSTSEVYALLARKPIVICNYFGLEGDVFLDKTLAINCMTPSSLISNIEMALSSNPASEQRREDFIREFMFKWDGRASERICEEILLLLERNKNK